MNNDIIREIDFISKTYFARIEKACRIQSNENWQAASAFYNFLCGYKSCLESLDYKSEAEYLDKKIKFNIDK